MYHVIQKFRAFSLTDQDQLNWCSTKPHHCFAYQCLENIKIYKHANDQNIYRVMSIFTNGPLMAKLMLGKAWSPFCIPVSGQCYNKYVCKIWSKYIIWFKNCEDFHFLAMTSLIDVQQTLVHHQIHYWNTCLWNFDQNILRFDSRVMSIHTNNRQADRRTNAVIPVGHAISYVLPLLLLKVYLFEITNWDAVHIQQRQANLAF